MLSRISHVRMSKLSLGLHILVICIIILAHQSQGDRFQPTTQEENAGLSPRLVSMKVKYSNPQDMDPNFRSLNNTTSSIQTSYGQALPSENGGDYPSYFAVHETGDHDSDTMDRLLQWTCMDTILIMAN